MKIRGDKKGTRGKAISHWDDKGHALSWQFTVPKTGQYDLVVRYCTPKTKERT